MEKALKDIYDFAVYIRNFNIHYSLLLKRYSRFKEINVIGGNDIDVITYFDMIIVQLRALCIENSRYRNNYTVQVLLRKMGEDKIAEKIDELLNQDFFRDSSEISIKMAIKMLADNFICHYDNFDDNINKLSLTDIMMNQLKNPYKAYQTVDLDYIMSSIIECIGGGLQMLI